MELFIKVFGFLLRMNKINLTFLGTSSMMPTKTRGQSGIFIDCGTEKILFDCGENIQRQMRIAGISSSKITRIFITHWHGDHVFGLPGLLENIGKNSANPKIEIYGTKEVGLKINSLIKTFDLKDKIKIKFNKIEENGIFFEDEKLKFGAYLLNHKFFLSHRSQQLLQESPTSN